MLQNTLNSHQHSERLTFSVNEPLHQVTVECYFRVSYPRHFRTTSALCAEFLIAFAEFSHPPLQITTGPHVQVKQNGVYENINADVSAKSIKLIL